MTYMKLRLLALTALITSMSGCMKPKDPPNNLKSENLYMSMGVAWYGSGPTQCTARFYHEPNFGTSVVLEDDAIVTCEGQRMTKMSDHYFISFPHSSGVQLWNVEAFRPSDGATFSSSQYY